MLRVPCGRLSRRSAYGSVVEHGLSGGVGHIDKTDYTAMVAKKKAQAKVTQET